MGLDFSRSCRNGFQAERDFGVTGGGCPCTTTSCGNCGDRCCDLCCQLCVEACCGLCSGDCSYTFCTLCLGLTQDLLSRFTTETQTSDVEGYESGTPWLKQDVQEVVDFQTKGVLCCHRCGRRGREGYSGKKRDNHHRDASLHAVDHDNRGDSRMF